MSIALLKGPPKGVPAAYTPPAWLATLATLAVL